MKKPHGLYLPETPHNRATAYVRNALDGAGSLPDFVAYIERAAFEAFHEGAVIDAAGDAARDRLGGLKALQGLPPSKAKAPLNDYLQAWSRLEDETPTLAPAARHLLGLFLLVDQADQWQVYYERDALFEEPEDDATLLAVADAFRSRGAPSRRSQLQKSYPIIRRNRIELTQEPYAPGKVSLTLDDEHHAFHNNVFGSAFYARLEHALIHHFEDRDLVHDVSALGRFLERGSEGYDTEALQAFVDRLLEYRRENEEDLYEMTFPPEEFVDLVKDAVAEGSPRLWSTHEGELLTADIWARDVDYRPERDGPHLALLRLAIDLDVFDRIDVRDLPATVARTLRERFNMRPLRPTRGNLLAYLDGTVTTDAPEAPAFDTAVDYHLWQLFKLYAGEALGVDAASSHLRDDYLATLAQPGWFPIEATLQAFSGLQVKRVAQDEWVLAKGNKAQRTLSHAQAEAIAYLLQRVVDPFDRILRIQGSGAAQALPRLLKQPIPAFRIPVGLETIARAANLLAEHAAEDRTTAFHFLEPLVEEQLGLEAADTLLVRIQQRSRSAS